MERIRTAHPDPFHATPEPAFQAAADELAARADGLSEDQLLVELMRFSCLLGERDGHSGIFPLDSPHQRVLHLFPLYLYKFSDGLFVVAAPGRESLVGSKVLALDGIPADELERQVRPLVPRDNEATRDDRFMSFLLTAEVLHGLGLRAGTGPAALHAPAARRPATAGDARAGHRRRLSATDATALPVVRLRVAETSEAALPATPRRGPLRHDRRPRQGRLRRLQHDGRLDLSRGAARPASRAAAEGTAGGRRRPAQPRRRQPHLCATVLRAALEGRKPAREGSPC